MASISFPAIGTGNLGFPRDLVSRILLSEIYAFSARVSPRFLNEVTVIVHPSDSETVQVLKKLVTFHDVAFLCVAYNNKHFYLISALKRASEVNGRVTS